MTDATGHMDRPGASPASSSLYVSGIPLNVYINYNPQSGRVEIVKPMPAGTPDELINDFPDAASARAWANEDFTSGRLPAAV